MAKVIIEFDKFDERYEYECALFGQDAAHALQEISQKIRNFQKHVEPTPEHVEALLAEIKELTADVLCKIDGG